MGQFFRRAEENGEVSMIFPISGSSIHPLMLAVYLFFFLAIAAELPDDPFRSNNHLTVVIARFFLANERISLLLFG